MSELKINLGREGSRFELPSLLECLRLASPSHCSHENVSLIEDWLGGDNFYIPRVISPIDGEIEPLFTEERLAEVEKRYGAFLPIQVLGGVAVAHQVALAMPMLTDAAGVLDRLVRDLPEPEPVEGCPREDFKQIHSDYATHHTATAMFHQQPIPKRICLVFPDVLPLLIVAVIAQRDRAIWQTTQPVEVVEVSTNDCNKIKVMFSELILMVDRNKFGDLDAIAAPDKWGSANEYREVAMAISALFRIPFPKKFINVVPEGVVFKKAVSFLTNIKTEFDTIIPKKKAQAHLRSVK